MLLKNDISQMHNPHLQTDQQLHTLKRLIPFFFHVLVKRLLALMHADQKVGNGKLLSHNKMSSSEYFIL